MWQDTVIAICQMAFLPALWPTVKGKDKPALSTCALHVIIISIITFTLTTLELWLTAGTAALLGITWTILTVQRYQMDRRKTQLVPAEAEESDLNE